MILIYHVLNMQAYLILAFTFSLLIFLNKKTFKCLYVNKKIYLIFEWKIFFQNTFLLHWKFNYIPGIFLIINLHYLQYPWNFSYGLNWCFWHDFRLLLKLHAFFKYTFVKKSFFVLSISSMSYFFFRMKDSSKKFKSLLYKEYY